MTLIMRLVRSEMQEVLRQDYIRFARARGLTSRAVHFRHALVNTLVPVTTVIGLQLGSIIAFGIVTETVFQWPVQGRDTRGLAEGLLEQVGLSAGDAARFPHEFSGGQRQRICIARALSSRPRLIICDEPTSALDMSVQAQVLNLMNDLKDELGLTYMFISHDLTVVRHMADRVGVLYLGLLVEEAATRDLFDDPEHPYTRMLINVDPRIDVFGTEPPVSEGEIASPINQPPGYAYNPRCPSCVDVGLSEKPELALLRGARVACHRAQ